MEFEERLSEIEKIRKIGLKKQAGIREKYLNASFENFEISSDKQKKLINSLKKKTQDIVSYVNSGEITLFLGRYGTGKTHLAVAILQQCLKKGIKGKYLTISEMMRNIKDSFDNSDLSTKKVMNGYILTPLLIIDEIGRQFQTEMEKLMLSEILSARHEKLKSTILISNIVNQEELENLLTSYIMDRIYSFKKPIYLFDWESYRRKR